MIVRGEDDNPVDVEQVLLLIGCIFVLTPFFSDVDCSFFLVTVDLWSGDGKQETNLVLHPSSAERHPPPHSARPKRRGANNNNSASHPRSSGNHTPISKTTPTPAQYRTGEQVSQHPFPKFNFKSSVRCLKPSGFTFQAYFPPDQLPISPPTPYSATSSEPPTWGYNAQSPTIERNNSFPPPHLPSIHSFAQSEPAPGASSFRGWDAGAPYPPPESYANSQVDPALRPPSNSDGREWSQTGRYSQDTYPPAAPQLDNSMYTPTPYIQHPPPPPPSHAPHYSSHYPPHVHAHATSQQSANSTSSPPRHSYTRTLVGPLASNASRLLDEHRKPGIFFLFQDLSIRTEGGSILTFDLKFNHGV